MKRDLIRLLNAQPILNLCFCNCVNKCFEKHISAFKNVPLLDIIVEDKQVQTPFSPYLTLYLQTRNCSTKVELPISPPPVSPYSSQTQQNVFMLRSMLSKQSIGGSLNVLIQTLLDSHKNWHLGKVVSLLLFLSSLHCGVQPEGYTTIFQSGLRKSRFIQLMKSCVWYHQRLG